MTVHRTQRLTVDDRDLARAMFSMMADVFEEPSDLLSDGYLDALLERPDFWALAALVGDEVVGGLTGHAMPMTRAERSEIFIYDLAVRKDWQRKGIGRDLIRHLRHAASAQGIDVVFVPAENEDAHAIEFYRSVGAIGSAVTFFTFE